jgi:hypothetical protein
MITINKHSEFYTLILAVNLKTLIAHLLKSNLYLVQIAFLKFIQIR